MAEPTSRDDFIEYCLRRLGKPVIEINIAMEQVEDRVNDALKYFYEYHFEGSEKVYYKHEITAQDKENRYIELPENILGAVKLFNSSTFSNSYSMFDVRYQIALNDLYTLTTKSIVPYFMTMQHLGLLEQMLVGERAIRYNRHVNKLYIDTNWDKYNEGDFLVVEAWQVVDPDVYVDVWKDRWLQRYATALIKRQWGENLMKFRSMPLPGGMVLNGENIYNDAIREIEKLESEMINSYSIPMPVWIG